MMNRYEKVKIKPVKHSFGCKDRNVESVEVGQTSQRQETTNVEHQLLTARLFSGKISDAEIPPQRVRI